MSEQPDKCPVNTPEWCDHPFCDCFTTYPERNDCSVDTDTDQ